MVAITRRQLLLGGGALLMALPAHAGPAKARRVGVLTGNPESFFRAGRFEESLRKLNWTQDLEVLYRFNIDGEAATMRAREEFLKQDVEVLLVIGIGIPESRLPSFAESVPCVALLFADPVAEKAVASLARPGGNLTGVMAQVGWELPKFIETVREAFPKLKRLGVLYLGNNGWQQTEERALAARFGIELVPMPVASRQPLKEVLASPNRRKVDAVWVFLDPEWFIPDVAAALRDARLPAISDVVEFAEAGGLMAFGTGVARTEVFAQLARQVDKILRGARAGDIPIEFPVRLGLAVNLSTAKLLGYVMPPSIQVKATRLID